MHVIESKALLNFKFPVAITKGRGTQAYINMNDYNGRNSYYDYN